MLWKLFLVFMKIGLISFGGGYAVITIIEHEVHLRYWMSASEFQEIVALAGMAPGPIATNSATLIGYRTAGILGAISSTLGMILPSLVIIIILAACFGRLHHNRWVKSSFYGLRPIVTGLIAYAAIHFGILSSSEPGLTWSTLATLLICAGCLYGIIRYKMHPLMVILASAAAGVILF
ncbi:chromate transporter [Paenibacillus guangzhouensis]|uniref:chromate transporter n=1 Tax=Paenibacillus guangzhouensis TaxID=1473112 RepID=UPI001266B36F|nr:chromate transporter [Paenibacillus guangzhouensis]